MCNTSRTEINTLFAIFSKQDSGNAEIHKK